MQKGFFNFFGNAYCEEEKEVIAEDDEYEYFYEYVEVNEEDEKEVDVKDLNDEELMKALGLEDPKKGLKWYQKYPKVTLFGAYGGSIGKKKKTLGKKTNISITKK